MGISDPNQIHIANAKMQLEIEPDFTSRLWTHTNWSGSYAVLWSVWLFPFDGGINQLTGKAVSNVVFVAERIRFTLLHNISGCCCKINLMQMYGK